ncbi:MAG: DUF1697 domain-containing protein, partial [Planctomycetota bacterium]
MKTWIALFRGINMVGRHLLPMKELVALLERLGARDVKTCRQGGNAVLRHRAKNAARLAGRISAAIGKEYGFEPLVILLEAEQLARIIADNPFPEGESEPGLLAVGFLLAVPEQPDLEALEAVRKKSERFALRGEAFYFHAPEGFYRSKLAGRIERSLGVAVTGRA